MGATCKYQYVITCYVILKASSAYLCISYRTHILESPSYLTSQLVVKVYLYHAVFRLNLSNFITLSYRYSYEYLQSAESLPRSACDPCYELPELTDLPMSKLMGSHELLGVMTTSKPELLYHWILTSWSKCLV